MYKVYGIIGSPVDHSLSPCMHNAAFKELGINAVYGAFDVPKEKLESAVAGIKSLGIKGVSVTIPHKEAVMNYLDEISASAQSIGAVNTLINENGRLLGENTDWIGVREAFLKSGTEVQAKKVVVIGAGGAARAVVYALKSLGAGEILIYNRTFERAKELAESIGGKAIPWEELKSAEGDIIVQTTSVGLKEWKSPVDEDVIKRFKVAMDIVYLPLKTKFLTLASRCGLKTIDGLQMLLYQGVEQFKLWTGVEPPVEVMEKAVYQEAILLERELGI